VRAETPDDKVNVRSYNIILPSTERSYELVADNVAQLLAADQGSLLYRNTSGAIVLRDAAGQETELQVPFPAPRSQWWLSAGHVIAKQWGGAPDLHVFTGPGTTLNLSTLAADYPASDSPVIHGPWPVRLSARHRHDRFVIAREICRAAHRRHASGVEGRYRPRRR
jgi:hypothetical protein